MKNSNTISVYIRSLIFSIFLPVWTVIICSALSPLVLFKKPKVMAILGVSWSYGTIFALKLICRIKIEVHGKSNFPKGPCIIACKHQSALETGFFQQYLKFPVYVIKRELLNVPFYGWFLKQMGMIPIDRNGGISALKNLLRDCEVNLRQNRSIIIFPEGTRIKVFESAEYHSGIVAIRKKFIDTPIIPIALNSGLFWPKDSWLKYPGTVIFKVLPALDRDLDNKQALAQLKKIIDSNSDELCKK